jgi:hypothetical protein
MEYYVLFPVWRRVRMLHCSPASRESDEKGNPVPVGISGSSCHWGTKIQGPSHLGWRLDARLTTLLSKNNIVTKYKKVETGCNLAESSKEGYGSEGLFCRRRWWLCFVLLLAQDKESYSKCSWRVESWDLRLKYRGVERDKANPYTVYKCSCVPFYVWALQSSTVYPCSSCMFNLA